MISNIYFMNPLTQKLSKKNISDEINFELLEQFIPNLSEKLNPYKKIFNNLLQTGILEDSFNNHIKNDFSLSMALFKIREKYTKDFGFYLVSKPFLKICSDLFKDMNILEVGAGTGFLSYQLQKLDLHVTAIDQKIQNNTYGFQKTYFDIIEDDAIDFLKNHSEFDLIIMSWPNYNTSFAYNILKNMRPKQKLLYIGEGFGGCTANDHFFDLLTEKAIELPETNLLQNYSNSWPSIHDLPFLYEIKGHKYSKML